MIQAQQPNNKQLPYWMQADDISCGEYMELRFYKCVTLIPTCITMTLLLVLSIYYIFVSA